MYKPGGESVALESDIHSTGWTPEVAKLVKLTVVPATKEHTDYYEE